MSPLKNIRSLLYLSFFLFLGFGIFTIITPTFNSSAEEIDVNAEVDSVISLSLSNNDLGINITPGTTGSASTTATVSTNSINGYTLTMSAKTDETALIHSSDAVSDKIATSDAASLDTLAVNNWAYGLDGNDELFAVPRVSSPINIKTTDTPSNSSNNTTAISVGVKVNSSIASGRYSNTLVFSAVGNAAEVAFSDIPNMQSMSTGFCDSIRTPAAFLDDGVTINSNVPSGVLTDTRDGKSYTVAKLADGKCWMTQNLALGGDSPITLTPEDSDVESEWTLKPFDTKWASSYDDAHYWMDDASQNIYGNYYNWPAATAESGDSGVISVNTSQSICPKGWKLPKGGSFGTDFSNLFNSYDIRSNTAGAEKVQSAPLSFLKAGLYYNEDIKKGFINRGDYGYYWTSTARDSSSGAYGLYFGSSFVRVDGRVRDAGLNIRCIAR